MNREIKTTNDGSKTLFINELNEGYHSHHGALQEAIHVFIKNGIEKISKKNEINILELGFGSGLNVLVTIEYLIQNNLSTIINYFSLEKYPLFPYEIEELEFFKLFDQKEMKNIYHKIHQCKWEKLENIHLNFNLKKINCDFYDLKNQNLPPIDLVYYDCFGARVQPDLWELPFVKIVTDKIMSNGLLTTYSSKGSFKRILENLGFSVQKLEGPKGKREMINAWKKE